MSEGKLTLEETVPDPLVLLSGVASHGQLQGLDTWRRRAREKEKRHYSTLEKRPVISSRAAHHDSGTHHPKRESGGSGNVWGVGGDASLQPSQVAAGKSAEPDRCLDLAQCCSVT